METKQQKRQIKTALPLIAYYNNASKKKKKTNKTKLKRIEKYKTIHKYIKHKKPPKKTFHHHYSFYNSLTLHPTSLWVFVSENIQTYLKFFIL